MNHPKASKLPAVLKICGKCVFCNPANDLNNPHSDTTPEWGLTVTKPTVYVCDTKNSGDILDDSSKGDPVARMLSSFPQIKGLVDLRVPRQYDEPEDKWNAILRVRLGCIDQLVYPFHEDITSPPWQGEPFPRDKHEKHVYQYLHGCLRITKNGKAYSVNAEGPKIIVVDSSKKNHRNHPSPEQYAKIVKRVGGMPYILRESGHIIDPNKTSLDDAPEYKRELFALRIQLGLEEKGHGPAGI